MKIDYSDHKARDLEATFSEKILKFLLKVEAGCGKKHQPNKILIFARQTQ